MVISVMTQLIKEGKVTRGWLGVTIQNITPELAKEFGLKKPGGALITDIFKESPAEIAGLQRGDIILEVNGKKIKDVESLRNTVAQTKVGSTIKLKVIRNGKHISLKVAVTEFPENLAEVMPGKPKEGMAEKNELVGLSVIELTTEIAKQLGLPRDEKGVVIVRVEPYSNADEGGFKKGDVIQEMKRKKVNNLRDFNNIVSRLKEGDTVLLYVNRGGKKFYRTIEVNF
jgi:serine protease Do